MKHASIALSLDADIHLVLCRFGRAGLAYVETDPAEADATTVIHGGPWYKGGEGGCGVFKRGGKGGGWGGEKNKGSRGGGETSLETG